MAESSGQLGGKDDVRQVQGPRLDTSSPEVSSAAYFTDRCGASIEVKRDTLVPCGLKLGHEGPHEPIEVGKQTVSESPAAMPLCGGGHAVGVSYHCAACEQVKRDQANASVDFTLPPLGPPDERGEVVVPITVAHEIAEAMLSDGGWDALRGMRLHLMGDRRGGYTLLVQREAT